MKMGDFDVSNVPYRSDIWMVHFMESAFDDAMACCDKSVHMKPKNAFQQLHLGEMDGFPMAMYRFLSRTYSVMTVRHKICLELLVTLESIMMSGEVTSPTFGMYEPSGLEEVAVDGDRCAIFAKFLSEEYD